MKHAILVLWHNDFSQLTDLITLFDYNFEFYIHIDKKSRLPEEQIRRLAGMPSVKGVYCKYKINWGGINILRAQLFVLQKIVKEKRHDYIHFMSGQDYPAKSTEQINRFFTENAGWEFISHFRLPYAKWENNTYNRFDYFRLHDLFDYRTPHGQKMIDRIKNLQIKMNYKRRIPHQYSCLYGGSNWMSITRQCAEFLISSLSRNKAFFNRLKYTWAPEETYFPTVIMNSPFAEKVKNDHMRYIKWEYKNGSFPAILDERDIEDIVSSGCCFIRKVDPVLSKNLLAYMDQAILQFPPG